MIVDCTMFHWEFDILELRLRQLWDTVDYFFVTESVCDHRGKERELVLTNNISQFDWASEKLIVNVSDKPRYAEKTWDYEHFQRAESVRACEKIANPNDLIIISDIDEIVRPESLEKANRVQGIFTMHMPMFYYYLNLFVHDWYHPKAITYRYLDDANKIRMRDPIRTTLIPNAGWHFSYLGTPEQIQYKLKTFAHDEFDFDEYTSISNIKERVNTHSDLFKRFDKKFEVKNIKDMPSYVINNIEKYQKYLIRT